MGDSKDDVIGKIKDLVLTTYGGSNRKAFDHYDRLFTQNGKVGKDGILQLMADAGVDTTKFGINVSGTYADKIIGAIDGDKDVEVSWDEFEKAFSGG